MRNITVSAMLVALALTIIAGCSDAQKQDWNEFWGVNSGPKRSVKSAPDQKKNGQTQKASAQKPAGKTAAPAKNAEGKPDEQKAEEVDEDVSAYSAKMNPAPKETPNRPNDHNSKIQRQHDPDRQKRIREAAAKENESEAPVAANSGDSALKRYEKNTGVKTEDEATLSADKPGSDTEEAQPAEGGKSVVKTAAQKNVRGAKTNVDGPKPAAESDGTSDDERVAGTEQSDEQSDGDHKKPMPEKSAENTNPATLQDDPAEKPAIHANTNPEHADELKSTDPEVKHEPKKGVPELAEMSVSAAPEPEPKAAIEETKPIATMANTSGTAASAEPTFAARIADQEKLVSTDPNNLEEQYRLRMMYLIDGQDNKAKAEIPGVDADLQQIIAAQISSLISARSTSGRDPATWATRQLESIEELRRLVKERADLVVTKVALCTAVEGFGRYKPIDPAEFKAGKKHRVVIYIEIDNFSCVPLNSGMYRTLLSVRQTLLTKDGKEIWSEKAENIEDLARRPRRDFYLCTTPIAIPKTLPPGDYLLKAEVEDVLAGKINSGVATFEIVP